MSKSRASDAHQNKGRPARIPLSSGNKLQVPDALKKEGYCYYCAVDRKGMSEQMEAAYYEKVTDGRGEHVTVPAGSGELHYRMCIEKEYHDEDMQKQQALNIDATASQAQKLGESEYVPMGREQVTEREIIQRIRL